MTTSSIARLLTRALQRTASKTSCLRPVTSQVTYNARQFQQSAHRQYSSQVPRPKSTTTIYLAAATAITALAGGYYLVQSSDKIPEIHLKKGSANETIGIFKPTPEDYQKVYNTIANLLWEKDDYDDGSYGPVVLRLAFHASGTYDAATNTGGSNGATMRFAPERDQGANSGPANARNFLEPVKEKFPWISYSDLWTLGGVCAVQEMQGPVVPWRPGRHDRDMSYCSPDGRLPNGSKGQDHIRAIFGRMGFNDQEIVALLGAHALGRCHQDRSGFDGPWTFSPTVLTNDFYRLLIEEEWNWRQWNGENQYQDKTTKSLMMLPTDMALIKDKEFKKYVTKYAEDGQVFFKDFSDAIVKMFELGVPFEDGAERLRFVRLDEQEA